MSLRVESGSKWALPAGPLYMSKLDISGVKFRIGFS